VTDPVPRVKEPHLAGNRWYPAEPATLARRVVELLTAAGPPRPGVVAILVPHGTLDQSGAIAALGFAAARGRWRRAIVLAPSHFAAFRGAALLPVSGYRTPLGIVPIDEEGVRALAASALVRTNPAVFMREHALEMMLPLWQTIAPERPIVPLLVGKLEDGDATALATALRPCHDAESLLVVSSDLVHYGRRFDYLPVPPRDAATVSAAVRRLDDGALARIVARDADGFVRYVAETGATICGRTPIEVGLRMLGDDVRGESLGCGTSLDVDGDYERTVGYAAVGFARMAA
jgi:AmmeMemoRadiSam system protein B